MMGNQHALIKQNEKYREEVIQKLVDGFEPGSLDLYVVSIEQLISIEFQPPFSLLITAIIHT